MRNLLGHLLYIVAVVVIAILAACYFMPVHAATVTRWETRIEYCFGLTSRQCAQEINGWEIKAVTDHGYIYLQRKLTD